MKQFKEGEQAPVGDFDQEEIESQNKHSASDTDSQAVSGQFLLQPWS